MIRNLISLKNPVHIKTILLPEKIFDFWVLKNLFLWGQLSGERVQCFFRCCPHICVSDSYSFLPRLIEDAHSLPDCIFVSDIMNRNCFEKLLFLDTYYFCQQYLSKNIFSTNVELSNMTR